MKSNFTMRMLVAIFVATLLGTVNSFADYEFTIDNKDYKLVTAQATWKDAAAAAKDAGAKLAEITTAGLQTAIEHQLFKKSGMNTTYVDVADGGGVAYIWIGGNDINNEGNWYWDGMNSGDGTLFWTGQGGAGDDNGKPNMDAYNNWGNKNCNPTNSTTCEPDNFNDDQNGLGLCVEPNGWPFGDQGEWNDIDEDNELYYLIEYLPKAEAPTDLQATANKTDATIELTWKDNSDDETGFRLYRTNGDNEVYWDFDPNTENFIDMTAEAGIVYSYHVVAMIDNNPSDPTATRNAILNMALSTPTGIKVTLDNTPVVAVITWKDNSNNESGYKVIRQMGEEVVEFKLPANTEEFRDVTIYNGRTYTYTVVAFKNGVTSNNNPMAEFKIQATTPAPTNLEFTIDPYKQVILTWEDNADDETKYVITRKIADEKTIFELPANTTTFTDNTVEAGKAYIYYVETVRQYLVNEELVGGNPEFGEVWSAPSNMVISGTVEVTIQGFTKELIECEGVEDLELYCTAITDIGIEPNFDWYKDGEMIQGKHEHVLEFDDFPYTSSGVYRARAYMVLGEGKDAIVVEEWTDNISVYALTRPEVIEQPTPLIEANTGDDITLSVRVHYRGQLPPLYQDDFQWFKVENDGADTIPIENSDRIAGAKASRMTISDVKTDDLCKDGEFYFVRVIGQCATVYSEPSVIAKSNSIVFEKHPERQFVCPGSTVTLNAKAVPQGDFDVEYKWLKDGTEIVDYLDDKTDKSINGAKTNQLQITLADETDEATYVCVATMVGTTKTAESHPAELELKVLPEAAPAGDTEVSILRGRDVTFTVDPSSIKGTEPMTVTWNYKGEELANNIYSAKEPQLLEWTVMAAELDDAGEYTLRLENDCDFVEVVFTLTVNKWDQAGVNDNNSLFELFDAMPTPSIDYTTINFNMVEAGNAVVTLYDANGKSVVTLFNSYANEGVNTIAFDVNDYNLNNGVYYYTLETPKGTATKRLVITK